MFRSKPEFNTKCWNCGKRDDLVWAGGFGYGKRCRCGDNAEVRTRDAKLSIREIDRRARRLRPFELPRETWLA